MMDIRIDYKAEFNSEISATNWRGWKTLFIQGVILPCPIFGTVITNEKPTADPNTIFAKVMLYLSTVTIQNLLSESIPVGSHELQDLGIKKGLVNDSLAICRLKSLILMHDRTCA